MSSIKDNIQSIRQRIKAGRVPAIMAVVKTVETPAILEALECGIGLIGENRVQEAKERVEMIRSKYPEVKIHFIGHLQTNKINQALQMFDVIEGVDSLELAEAIDKRAQKPVEIFIEVNTSGEESKFGVVPEKAIELIGLVSKLPNIKLSGLMTIGSLTGETRECFKTLKRLKAEAEGEGKAKGLRLSMGMTEDFDVAIEEGSDIIRIGRGIFGARRK